MTRTQFGLDATGNPALRLVVVHSLFGAAAGLVFAAALVALNAHGLGGLMLGSDAGLIGFALLASGFMVTFASLAAGTAVMQIGSDRAKNEDPRGPSASALSAGLVPCPVRVMSEPRRRLCGPIRTISDEQGLP